MKRVLIVDDELSISNFIVEIIRVLGHESKILTSGKKVLATVKEWKPDLITLDVMMPSPDGLEILARLKSEPDTRHIPVFIISVMANNSGFEKKLATADRIFSKPIETKELIDAIQKALQA